MYNKEKSEGIKVQNWLLLNLKMNRLLEMLRHSCEYVQFVEFFQKSVRLKQYYFVLP